MEMESLKNRPEITTDEKLSKKYGAFRNLLTELGQRDLPATIIDQINERIRRVNTFQGTTKALKKVIHKERTGIVRLVEKELKLVPKGYYRNLWLALGMSTFGIPMGVVFGLTLDNMAFLGIGMPIGMAIGIAIGANLDQKAAEEGRQLNFEV